MLDALNLNPARWRTRWTFAFVMLTATFFIPNTFAQSAGARDKIYVVTHFDTMPPNVAGPILSHYAEDTRKDKGAVRVELYSEIGRTNHFVIVEEWESQCAFDAHEAAAHTRQFREQIQPVLASPWDQRVDRLVDLVVPKKSG
jgi:quinol monooxygenase YgiN